MSPAPQEFRTKLGKTDLTFTVGKYAGQADAAVTVRAGDTVVLVTALLGNPKPDTDFMPLLVEYEEKFYAAGKIKGSRFVKREGRPTDLAITAGRIVDRSIRPLFPRDLRNDLQVVATCLSYDGANDPDVLALLGASAALACSPAPWNGPLGAARVGRVEGAWVVQPTVEQLAASDLDLVVATTEKAAVMVEADARELKEEEFLEAVAVATKAGQNLAGFIKTIASAVGQKKVEGVRAAPLAALDRLRPEAERRIREALAAATTKLDVHARIGAITDDLVRQQGQEPGTVAAIRQLCHQLYRDTVREGILAEGRRVGGRKLDEVRPLTVEVGVLPRTHGSALFQRGETQILSTVTLGGPDDAMILDTMTETDTKKRFFHFYNMPGYSVGEIKPMRGPGRRDIGHGMLAERSLHRLLPRKEDFPYTVMTVSEVLSSNGSSSMGSVCGASLALMDAGVPIPRHVAGIAMGLVTDETGKKRPPKVLTDIAGMEDEGGDMDFKVAGTREGITAVQVDIKVQGLMPAIVREAVLGAKIAREQILDAMEAVLAAPRPDLSPYAPRIVTFMIPAEKIGDVIGPRGTIINKITEETSCEITIEDDGQVSITGVNGDQLKRAEEWVKQLVREAVPGEECTGTITRLMKFGAFVEIFPGTEGLIHVSDFGPGYVRNVEDVVKVGETVEVIVKEIDEQGRVNLVPKKPLAQGEPRRDQFGPRGEPREPRTGFRPTPRGRGPRGGFRGAPSSRGFGGFRRSFRR